MLQRRRVVLWGWGVPVGAKFLFYVETRAIACYLA